MRNSDLNESEVTEKSEESGTVRTARMVFMGRASGKETETKQLTSDALHATVRK